MSVRVCAWCDWVINNRTQDDWDCPNCGSDEMACPITDTRDWNKMYKEQMEEVFKLLSEPSKDET